MKKANEKRRDGELLSVWSLDGTIFVKTSPACHRPPVTRENGLIHHRSVLVGAVTTAVPKMAGLAAGTAGECETSPWK